MATAANLVIGSQPGWAPSRSRRAELQRGIQAAHGAIMQIGADNRVARSIVRPVRHQSLGRVVVAYEPLSDRHSINGIGILTDSANSWVYDGNISNAGQGFYCSTGGSMDCSNSVTAAIGSGDYVAAHGAYMYAAGFQEERLGAILASTQHRRQRQRLHRGLNHARDLLLQGRQRRLRGLSYARRSVRALGVWSGRLHHRRQLATSRPTTPPCRATTIRRSPRRCSPTRSRTNAPTAFSR